MSPRRGERPNAASFGRGAPGKKPRETLPSRLTVSPSNPSSAFPDGGAGRSVAPLAVARHRLRRPTPSTPRMQEWLAFLNTVAGGFAPIARRSSARGGGAARDGGPREGGKWRVLDEGSTERAAMLPKRHCFRRRCATDASRSSNVRGGTRSASHEAVRGLPCCLPTPDDQRHDPASSCPRAVSLAQPLLVCFHDFTSSENPPLHPTPTVWVEVAARLM